MAGMTVLLLLLWAGVTVSSPVDLQKRVVGGHTCDSATRHYHVFVKGFGGSMCGGSLISEQWVLTAEHCWKSTVTAFLDVHPGDLEKNKEEKGGVKIIDRKIYRDSAGRSHDLMLLKKEVEVAGYGGIDKPSLLQCGNFMILPDDKCKEIKTALLNCKKAEDKLDGLMDFFCYPPNTASTAPGDSGGGVVHNKKLYGVHVATSTFAKCVKSHRGMNLCNKDYRDWITQTTGIQL